MKIMNFNLTDREIATVLASLRYWQLAVSQSSRHNFPQFDDCISPLSDTEIDNLCESINSDNRKTVTINPKSFNEALLGLTQ